MNSSFSFFLAWIFCSLQMRSTRTALSGASSAFALWSFCPWGKICTLSPVEDSSEACQSNSKKQLQPSTKKLRYHSKQNYDKRNQIGLCLKMIERHHLNSNYLEIAAYSIKFARTHFRPEWRWHCESKVSCTGT